VGENGTESVDELSECVDVGARKVTRKSVDWNTFSG
jgi:hypothetical protein